MTRELDVGIEPAGMTFERAMEIALASREKLSGRKYDPLGAVFSPAQRRIEIVRLTELGKSAQELAQQFGITSRTVSRIRAASRKANGG